MKKRLNNIFSSLSEAEREMLTMEIEETLATGFNPPPQKTFTAAELWNIQRRKKNVIQRRSIL